MGVEIIGRRSLVLAKLRPCRAQLLFLGSFPRALPWAGTRHAFGVKEGVALEQERARWPPVGSRRMPPVGHAFGVKEGCFGWYAPAFGVMEGCCPGLAPRNTANTS